MEWSTLEHSYTEKTNDWYASVILIAGALIAVEFLMNDFLLIALTFVATATFILLAARRPEMMHVEIGKKGIRAGNVLYPYITLTAFAIREYHTNERRLILETNGRFVRQHVIPIAEDVDLDRLHTVLSEQLEEKDIHESLSHIFLERLGF